MANHCDVCEIDLIDEYSYHGHLMGKKHLKRVEIIENKKKKEENSIFVSPIPQGISQDEIVKFFTQFGPIENYKFGYKYVIIEYENKEPANFLLNTPTFFKQWKLNIQKRKFPYPPNKQNTRDDNNDEHLAKRLKFESELELESTFAAKLDKFIKYVQDDDAIVQERCDQVCRNLNSLLMHSFPRGRAIRFGSTVTGLHLKESDIDVYYDIGEIIYSEEQTKNVRGDRHHRWTHKSVFKEIKLLLYKRSSVFSQVVPIPLAKIPVIKFHHIPTNTDGDITFKHKLGVYNSQLIKHYLTFDTRLKPLMILIKSWAKSNELSGTGKITNYSLVMAIIFYLQQPNVNLIPTVKELQSECEPKYSNGWMINFNENIVSHNSNNESSIAELLHGFYKFYADFDFVINVICPYDGLIISKVDFAKNIEKLDINVNELRLNMPVCIQDPFQINHNIAERWSGRFAHAFQKCCNEGIQLCESAAKDDYTNFLPHINDPIAKRQVKSPYAVRMAIPAGNYETFGLPDDFETQIDIDNKEKYIENNWLEVVCKLVQKIFINIFKFEIQMMFDGMNTKQMKVDENSDVHSNDCDKILFICRGKYCLNRSRKNRISSLDPTLSCIDREILISDKIIAELIGRKEETTIKFVCTLKKKTNPLHVLMTLTNEQHTNKSFMEIGNYMQCKIPSIINKELAHMIQYDKKL